MHVVPIATYGRHVPASRKKLLGDHYRDSCDHRQEGFTLSLAGRTANDGKLDVAWGTKVVISDSTYELSCAHLLQAAQALSQ